MSNRVPVDGVMDPDGSINAHSPKAPAEGEIMPRFTVGARVRLAEPKTTGRVGTVMEILPGIENGHDSDHYRVQFTDGDVKVVSGLELSPAGSGPRELDDVA